LRLSQAELAQRVGISRGHIANLEIGRANPSLAVVEKVAAALDVEVDWLIRVPVVASVKDQVHARCSAHIGRRLQTADLLTAREVEIVHGRSHGWIDLLAFDPKTSTLLIIEVKTRLDDLGALERQMGWYERSALEAAHRIGWRPTRVVSWLLVLATADADSVLRSNRAIFDDAYPTRAPQAMAWLDRQGPLPQGRLLAMIDPLSRRRDWLIRTKFDGRRSEPPSADSREVAQRIATPA
jgi:transcriptional regulator with XRE-family HTH domain